MTTITDDFNRSDADALGSSSEGWSWTEVTGDIDIVSNEAKGGSATGRARAETDLASANHYAQCTVVTNTNGLGPMTRYSSSADSGYFLLADGRIFRCTSGALTQLVNVGTAAAGSVIRLESDGNTHEGFDDGATWTGPVSDSTHTSNTRTGIYCDPNQRIDDFEAGDLSAGSSVSPGTAALTLTAFAPVVSVSDHQTVTPGTAALTLTAFAPTVNVSDEQTVTPGTAALTLTGFAPAVSVSDHQTVTPGTAALTLTAFAPAVTTGGNQEVTPTTAALVLSALAPTVTASDHQTVTPGTAGLTLTTFAPTVAATANQRVTPGTAALSLATFAPAVTTSGHQTVTPGTAALVLATFAPTVLQLFPTTESFVRPRLFETQVGLRLFETEV